MYLQTLWVGAFGGLWFVYKKHIFEYNFACLLILICRKGNVLGWCALCFLSFRVLHLGFPWPVVNGSTANVETEPVETQEYIQLYIFFQAQEIFLSLQLFIKRTCHPYVYYKVCLHSFLIGKNPKRSGCFLFFFLPTKQLVPFSMYRALCICKQRTLCYNWQVSARNHWPGPADKI